jgi:WD40-like Beta Propeller Repeat
MKVGVRPTAVANSTHYGVDMRYLLRFILLCSTAICLLFPAARLLGSQRTDGQIVYHANFEGVNNDQQMQMLDVGTTIDVPYTPTLGVRDVNQRLNTPDQDEPLANRPAFIVYATDPPTARKDIFRALGIPHACCPIWSADGAWMTYMRSNTEVVIRSLITHEEHSLASSTSLAWSPDGHWLMYLGGAVGGKSLMMVSSNGQERHHAAQFNVSCVTPQWSPSGEQVAFSCYDYESVDIYVAYSTCHFVPTCETTLRQITHTGENEGPPTWSPDGQWIAYSRDNDSVQIYATHMTSGIERRMTYRAPASYAPRWTMLASP